MDRIFSVFVRHFKYGNLTITVDCPKAREFPSHEGFFLEDSQFYDYLLVIVTLITSIVMQHKALLSVNYCVNLGLPSWCSHSIFLIARPYPIVKTLKKILSVFTGQITFSNQASKKSLRAEGHDTVRSLKCKMQANKIFGREFLFFKTNDYLS
jgi:hypothetical protein